MSENVVEKRKIMVLFDLMDMDFDERERFGSEVKNNHTWFPGNTLFIVFSFRV